ncbi:MAG TPA: hypothetical protein VGV12_14965 [Gemmatimonadales bacterium]|nr:hypothetical protein [Gemmatimonadales bacterium]
MKRRTAYRCGSIAAAVAASIAVACSSSTSPHVAAPCPTYSGGSATPATLAGDYTLVSFCQDTLPTFGPAQGVTGSLTLTNTAPAVPDSFTATINVPPVPVVLAGPYTVSHDTITVNLPPRLGGTFTGTYAFSSNTLYVSGFLLGSPPPPLAIVFAK